MILKGATIATRAVRKWRDVMIKLSGLSTCLLTSAFFLITVWYVVCYQSVTINLNNSSGFVYNREFIT